MSRAISEDHRDLCLNLGSRFRVWFLAKIQDFSYRLLGEHRVSSRVADFRRYSRVR